MNTSNRSSTSNQFSIKRLFWTMIVASAVFKLADMFGFLGLIAGNWELARGSGRGLIIISIIVFSVIAVVYIGWFGIRLPHLIDQYFEIRKKRQLRRNELIRAFESDQKKQSE